MTSETMSDHDRERKAEHGLAGQGAVVASQHQVRDALKQLEATTRKEGALVRTEMKEHREATQALENTMGRQGKQGKWSLFIGGIILVLTGILVVKECSPVTATGEADPVGDVGPQDGQGFNVIDPGDSVPIGDVEPHDDQGVGVIEADGG